MTRKGTARPACAAAVKRCRRPTRWPLPAESLLSAEMIAGRLKRSAGSVPSTRLVTRHNATHWSTSHGSGANSSSAGPHELRAQAPAIGPPNSNAAARAAAEDGHHQRFAQVIPHQAPAAGAHRQSNGQLAPPHRAAHQHHAGDVQADDEQDDAGEAQQHQPRERDLGSQPRPGRKVRLGAAGLVARGRRMTRGQRRHRRLHDRVGLAHGGALGQPRQDLHPGRVAREAQPFIGDQARMA